MKFSSVRNCGVSGLTILCFAVMIVGCGGGDSSPSGPGNGGTNGGTNGGGLVSTTSVTVQDNVFDPSGIQVAPGATVTWTWAAGSDPHNVTWVDSGAGLASSSTQASGTHEVTMPQAAGEFEYYCTLHGTPTSGMHGRVVVD